MALDTAAQRRDVLRKDTDGDDTLQAIIDRSFESVFGPDDHDAPTPQRLKKLFDEGAQAVDCLFAKIKTEQTRHEMRIDTQVSALTTSAQNDRRAYRDDITRIRQEMDDALELIQTEMDAAYGPSVRGIPGLIALSRKNAEDIHELLAFAEAHVIAS